MNVATAVGALLVGLVSLWTTAQISDLEDYFRSEIGRRNSDLNALADQTRRLGALADEREKQLGSLQSSAVQIAASNLTAQDRLLATQSELSRLGFDVVAAKQTLASSQSQLATLTAQSAAQIDLIDLYRRQRFFESAHLRIIWTGVWGSDGDEITEGESVYRLFTEWPAGELDQELTAILPEFQANARRTCQWIRSYDPKVPRQQPYPQAPKMPGKLTADGQSKAMTQQEYDEWLRTREQWNTGFGEVSKANDRALKAAQEARDYLSKAGASCACQALATIKHPPSAICSTYTTPPPKPNQSSW